VERIDRRGFCEPELDAVEAAAIELAPDSTSKVLAAYALKPDTHGGRYVCADSIKELLPRFNESPQARSRFNGAVHNAAAVLPLERRSPRPSVPASMLSTPSCPVMGGLQVIDRAAAGEPSVLEWR
jgi:hypothetical protein